MHYLKSRNFISLLPQDIEESPPRLEQLILNNTGVDDEVTPYLACCSNLEVLELAGTRISSEWMLYLKGFLLLEFCRRWSFFCYRQLLQATHVKSHKL